MRYITSIERMALDQGRAEGRIEGLSSGIEPLLELRFGAEGLALMPRVRDVKDPVALEAFLKAIVAAPDLDALRNMLPPQPH